MEWSYPLQYSWASLVTQLVKNLPAMRETWVQSLGLEDPLERAVECVNISIAGTVYSSMKHFFED